MSENIIREALVGARQTLDAEKTIGEAQGMSVLVVADRLDKINAALAALDEAQVRYAVREINGNDGPSDLPFTSREDAEMFVSDMEPYRCEGCGPYKIVTVLAVDVAELLPAQQTPEEKD